MGYCIRTMIWPGAEYSKFRPAVWDSCKVLEYQTITPIEVYKEGIWIILPLIPHKVDEREENSHENVRILNPHGCPLHNEVFYSRDLYCQINRHNEYLAYSIRNDNKELKFYLVTLMSNNGMSMVPKNLGVNWENLGFTTVATISDENFIRCMQEFIDHEEPYNIRLHYNRLMAFAEHRLGYSDVARGMVLTLTFRNRYRRDEFIPTFRKIVLTDTITEIVRTLDDEYVRVTVNIKPTEY